MMKKVYICAPLGGNVDKNLKNIKDYTRYALMCGGGSGRTAFLCPLSE